MTIIVNGKPITIDSRSNCQDLIMKYNLQPDQLVVEINEKVIPKEKWKDHQLFENDQVELIQFVGGG
jgi:sulfur carrier protein